MDNIKHLTDTEGIEKIQELAKGETCFFCTFTGPQGISTRPMYTQTVEEDGSLWFFSGKTSNKNLEIAVNNKVQLLFGNPGKSDYLSVEGKASIITDQAKIDELWSDYVKAWFQGGKDDPELTLIKVTPSEAYYWDTKHGKLISQLKIMASVVAGKTMDDSIEGKITVD